jgi:hypothetical protein
MLVALLSRLETAGWPRLGFVLHRIHWQLHILRLRMSHRTSEKEKAHDRKPYPS